MPGYKGHLSVALALYGGLIAFLWHTAPSLQTLVVWFIAICAGALFPDIDTKSKGQKYFYWIMFFIMYLGLLKGS